MSSNYGRVHDTVSMSLFEEDNDISRDLIEERVKKISNVLEIDLSDQEKIMMVRELEATYQTTMGLGATLKDAEHKPWLKEHSADIDFYYWRRYKQLLVQNGFGNNVITKMDIVTNEILDLLQNPMDEGTWQRKGLVVGNVQSGKTANYSGLICKALDSGYRVVIILAGLLNSLRKQTQGRIDAGVIGIDSSLMMEDIALKEKLIGVGVYRHEKMPVSITTAHADFNKQSASQRQTAIDQFKHPLVFVVKKNVSILRNLIDWLKNNNLNLSDHPMLLIDDEADHASINTKNDDLDPTKTNDKIRELLGLFSKNVYLGYTATPFANIFISPETPEEMVDDLFPENFIKNLDAPTNYLGAERIFLQKEFALIREVDDYQNFLALKHKIHEIPSFIPDSLKEAIIVFILVNAIRILRGHDSKHNSMLVNVSRFTRIQSEVRLLIHDYLSQLVDSIVNYGELDSNQALFDSCIKDLFDVWKKEFINTEFKWSDIQKTLRMASARIQVIEVNSSSSAEKEIDYSARNYPKGRHIIAVGGLSLSRGLTLEGLSTTYFLRNSIMYDTLMQMGRWFGYRQGYEDLCRIYMTQEARGWYAHIASATQELKNEFLKMEKLNKTPKDFGLCVRNHPESLIVTARNKMRSARTVVREIDLTGRLIETSRLFTDENKVKNNLELLNNFIKIIENEGVLGDLGSSTHTLWTQVRSERVIDFIAAFENHPESTVTDSKAVKTYIEMLSDEEKYTIWNVLVVSVDKNRKKKVKINILQDALKKVNPGLRATTTKCAAGLLLSQRKLAAGGLETIDLKNREVRTTPLLMLHILDCRIEGSDTPVFPNGVAAYGISFPGEKNGRRIKKLATYQVNTTYWKNMYGSSFEDDDDMRGEYE
jgi:hypothetical protein